MLSLVVIKYHEYMLCAKTKTLWTLQLEEGKIEIPDPELKRQLSLSMEDLRFAENIVRQVWLYSQSFPLLYSLELFHEIS